MKSLLIIGIGGAIGSIGRYLMQVLADKYISVTFPLGTMVVNVTGCFLIGLLYGLAQKYAWMNLEWRLFLITGICGGYTTFSSYSYESFSLFKHGNYAYFLFYVLGSVVLGLLATVGGMVTVR
jgi:CrcB protein